MAGNDDFRLKIGVKADDAEIASEIQRIQKKLDEAKINVNKTNKVNKTGSGSSESKEAAAVSAQYTKINDILNNIQNNKRDIVSITKTEEQINSNIVRDSYKVNEQGKAIYQNSTLQVKQANQLKVMYDKLSANLKEQSSVRTNLVKISGQQKTQEEQLLLSKQAQLEADAKSYQKSISELKVQENINSLTKQDIEIMQQKAQIAEKVNLVQAKQSDASRAKEIKGFYQEIIQLLSKMDSLSKQIAKAEASKSKAYAEQLRLQRAETRELLNKRKAQFDTIRLNHQELNLDQQTYNISKKQAQNEKNILLYKHQALATLKSTKGVFSGFINELKVAVSRSIQWSLAMGALYGSIRQLKAGVQFLIDVDTSLTEIAMVTQQTREEVDHLARSYVNLARELKISTAEIMNSSVSLYRQGLNAAEVSERLVTISQTAKVTGEDINRVTDYVTAGVNALGVSAERYNDVLIKTASIAGTTYGELGEAVSKNASSFKNANVELEKVVSYMGAIIERTRESPTSVGTFGKTLVARFQRINQETGEANEELNKIQGAIESVGLDFVDSAGQIRSVSDILDELNVIWDDLDGNTQKYIATQAAGLRQGNRFLALMDGYERSLEIYDEALNASGTTQEQYNKYLESTQALIDELKVTWENLYLSVINSDWIKTFYNALIELVETLQIVIESIDILAVSFGSLLIINKVIPVLHTLSKFWVGGKLAEYGKSITTVSSKLEEMGDKGDNAAKGASKLLTTITNLNPVLLAVSAGIALFTYGIINAKKKAKEFEEGQKELQKTLKEGSLQQKQDTLESLEKLKSEYIEATNKVNNLKNAQDDLNPSLGTTDSQLKAVEDKMRQYGVTGEDIDKVVKELSDSIKAQKEETEEQAKWTAELDEIYNEHIETIKDYNKAKLDSHKQDLIQRKEEMETVLAAQQTLMSYFETKLEAFGPIDGMTINPFRALISNLKSRVNPKLEETRRNLDEIKSKIEAVDEVYENKGYSLLTPGIDDGDDDNDEPTMEDEWKDIADAKIKELEREKKHRENVWKQISDAHDETIEGLQEELNLMQEKNEELAEEEERREKIQALRKAEMELNNLLKERRFQRLQGGEWVNVADPRKVKEAQEEVANLREDYRSWEEQKEQEKEEKELQNAIDAEKTKKEAAEEKYRDIQEIADDVLNNIKDIDGETLGERELMLESYVNFYEEQMKKMEDLAGGFMPKQDYKSPSLEEFQDGNIRYRKIGDDIYKDVGEGWYKTDKKDRDYIPVEIGGNFGRESETPDIVARYIEGGITYTLDELGQISKGDRSITDPDSMKYIPSVIGGTREGQKSYQDIMNNYIDKLEIIANNPEEFGEALRLAARMNG